jgi:hypothetical protein
MYDSAIFLLNYFKNTLAILTGSLYRPARNLITAMVLLLVLVFLWAVYRRGVSGSLRLAASGVSLFATLPIVLTASYFMLDSVPRSGGRDDPAGRLVVALVFDELDEDMIDANIASLPNFASLKARSLNATQMYPPANYTSESLPGMITGEFFSDVHYSKSEVYVRPPGQSRWHALSESTGLFSEAARVGARVAIIGWHLPYCKLFRSARSCWDDVAFQSPGSSVSLTTWLMGHSNIIRWFEARSLEEKQGRIKEYSREFLNLSQMYKVQRVGQIFSEQKRRLISTLQARDTELVFAHLACPHPPALDEIVSRQLDMFEAYLLNLRVCDELLGRVVDILSTAKFDRGWTLIVTSDHWFRGRDWLETGRPNSMPMMRRPVPFYVASSNEISEETFEKTANLRSLPKVIVGALDSDFSRQRVKDTLSDDGDSQTLLRPY